MTTARTKIGLLKEEYAILINAMDELSKVYENLGKDRDRIAKRIEDIKTELAHEISLEVTPETLIKMEIDEVH